MFHRKVILCQNNLTKFYIFRNKFSYIDISEEVQHALYKKLPVVALESTIITHGMPKPQNIDCAISVEEVVRKEGVVPATIAILSGRIKVGLTSSLLHQLADPAPGTDVIKTSRRDLPYVVGNNRVYGGTTVSGTLAVCARAGLPLFATGGIGGVHREGENSMDISADLMELGRCTVGVICAGVKSILDIGRTLEYLETQGVCVSTYGPDKSFPAFYTRKSGTNAPYNVQTPTEAARMVHSAIELQLNSGLLFAVPVPEEHALSHDEMEKAIEIGLNAARENGITGKDITPFLLQFVSEVTKGKSLNTNIALVQNNAKIGSQIAVALVDLQTLKNESKSSDRSSFHGCDFPSKRRPVIIGGSVLDRHAALVKDNELKIEGRVYDVHTSDNPGGVARNICDALTKLSQSLSNSLPLPIFLTAVGDDEAGRTLRSSVGPCAQYVREVKGASSAQCIVVLDNKGDCKLLLGDMDVHKMITPEMVLELEDVIKESPLMVFDGNLSLETMNFCLQLATKHNIPVIFEPTDQPVATKPFESAHWKAIKCITPNLNELRKISEHFCSGLENINSSRKLEAALVYGKIVAKEVNTVIVTLAEEGILIFRQSSASCPMDQFFINGDIQVRHYPVPCKVSVFNVSGAGDCFTAGIISGILQNKSEEQCVSLGFHAATAALKSKSAVPNEIMVPNANLQRLPKYVFI